MNNFDQTITIQKKNPLLDEVKSLLSDRMLLSRYKTLKDYIKAEDRSFTSKDLNLITASAENDIKEQCFYYAHLRYFVMDKTQEWGSGGEQQVKISFCRNILELNPEQSLTQEHAFGFMSQVEENFQKLKLSAMSLGEAKRALSSYKFTILGVSIPYDEGVNLTKTLHFLGSEMRIICSIKKGFTKFLLFEGKEKNINGATVVLVKKEISRSPDYLMSNAAHVLKRITHIREESLWTIFYQKWVPVFDQDFDVIENVKNKDAWMLSQAIKEHALSLYGVNNKEQLLEKKDEIFKDIRENIIFHELGHVIVADEMYDAEQQCILTATIYQENSIAEALDELRAEFAPKVGDRVGPMSNMVEVSKTDVNRAERLFYTYLSDVWFFDTEDEYMFPYSILMVMAYIRYIRPDKSVDFDKLEKNLRFNKEKVNTPDASFVEKLYGDSLKDIEQLEAIIKNATYKLSTDKNWKYMMATWKKRILEELPNADFSTVYNLQPVWINMVAWVKRISDSEKKLDKYIEKQRTMMYKKMLILAAGKKKADQLKYNHMKFIYGFLKSRKFRSSLISPS